MLQMSDHSDLLKDWPSWLCGALCWVERQTLLQCQPINTTRALLPGTSVSAHPSHFLVFLNHTRPLIAFRLDCQHFFFTSHRLWSTTCHFQPPSIRHSQNTGYIPHSQRKEKEEEEGKLLSETLNTILKYLILTHWGLWTPVWTDGAGPDTPHLARGRDAINNEWGYRGCGRLPDKTAAPTELVFCRKSYQERVIPLRL